ncbi:outer membrane beta-barrel protein [Halocola ammonii]
MKYIKLLSLVALLSLLSGNAYSQISAGGQLSFLKFMKGSDVKHLGLGLKGEYAVDDEKVVVVGFDYYLPYTPVYEFNAHALSSETTPSNIDVEVEGKITWFHVHAGMKYYFTGDYEDDFNLYGFAGIGFISGTVKSEVLTEYDEDAYELRLEDEEKVSSLTLNLGIGAEFDINFGYLFADFKFMLPPNNVNGQVVAVNIDPGLQLNAGIRIPFD